MAIHRLSILLKFSPQLHFIGFTAISHFALQQRMLPILTATTLLSYSTFLFDLDGVIKNGPCAIPHAADIVNLLYKNQKEVFFVSNNDWESPEHRVASFRKMGFKHVQPTDFINPVVVALEYFKENGFENSTMYVLAPDNVKKILREELGVTIVPEHQRIIKAWNFTDFNNEFQKHKPAAVIIDSFVTFTNENLAMAVNYLLDPKVQFFSLSGDVMFRGDHGLLIPDSGAYKMVVETVSGRKAAPLGKPSPALNDFLKIYRGLKGKKAIMFGDNLMTDIIMANQMEIDSCLMLTGVHGLKDVAQAQRAEELEKIPTFMGNFTLFAEELVA